MANPLTISAGQLRHRLAVQTFSESRDSQGGVTKSWSTDSTVWGSIRPLSGKELVSAQQVDAKVTHKIEIRYYSGLDTTYRIQNDSRTFNIIQVLNLAERDKLMVILAVESV